MKPKIYICLFGEDTDRFMVKLKSENVDVDSKGKPCKEKMSSVLMNVKTELQFEKTFSVLNQKPTGSDFYDFISNKCSMWKTGIILFEAVIGNKNQ